MVTFHCPGVKEMTYLITDKHESLHATQGAIVPRVVKDIHTDISVKPATIARVKCQDPGCKGYKVALYAYYAPILDTAAWTAEHSVVYR